MYLTKTYINVNIRRVKEVITIIGENIKRIRERQGLSIRSFADTLGVSAGVISNLEYGVLKNPERKMSLLKLISEKYNVPVEWILADDPEELPPLDDGAQKAQAVGEMIANDPVVKSFLDFWQQRTDAEKEVLQKAINDFADCLKQQKGK